MLAPWLVLVSLAGVTDAQADSLAATMQRTHLDFRVTARGYRAEDDHHAIDVDGSGRVTLRVSGGAEWSKPLELRLSKVCRGTVCQSMKTPQVRRGESGSLRLAWSKSLTEVWLNRRGSLEQVFELARAPEGEGPLTLVLSRNGMPRAGSANGSTFFSAGKFGFEYGAAFLVERGEKEPISVSAAGDTLTLTVSAAQVAARQGRPLVIDPVVKPEQSVETGTGLKPTAEAFDQTAPAVASGLVRRLVVWVDRRAGAKYEIRGARTDANQIIDFVGFPVAASTVPIRHLRVAAQGPGTFRVVYETDGANFPEVRTVVVDAVTGAAGPDMVPIVLQRASNPEIACTDGSDCLVVYDGMNGQMATRISNNLLGATNVLGGLGSHGVVAAMGQRYFSVWGTPGDGGTLLQGTTFERDGGVGIPLPLPLAPVNGGDPISLAARQSTLMLTYMPMASTVTTPRLELAQFSPLGVLSQVTPFAMGQFVRNSVVSVTRDDDVLLAWVDRFRIKTAVVNPSTMMVVNTLDMPLQDGGFEQDMPAVSEGALVYDEVTQAGHDIEGFAMLRDGGSLRGTISTSRPTQLTPAVAANGSQFAVAWSEWRGDHAPVVMVRRYDLAGQSIDDALCLAEPTTRYQRNPAVAWAGTTLLVAYEEQLLSGSAGGPPTRIRVAAISPVTGTPPTVFTVGTGALGVGSASIASNGTDLAIAYLRFTGTGTELAMSRMTLQGTVIGTPTTLQGNFRRPTVSWAGGKYLAAYEHAPLDAGTDVLVQALDVGSGSVVSKSVPGSFLEYPRLVTAPSGDTRLLCQETNGNTVNALMSEIDATLGAPTGIGSTYGAPVFVTAAPGSLAWNGFHTVGTWGTPMQLLSVPAELFSPLPPVMNQGVIAFSSGSKRAGALVHQRYVETEGTTRVFLSPIEYAADGTTCSENDQCRSGFCVGSVCCPVLCPNGTCAGAVCSNSTASPNGSPCSLDGDCRSTYCAKYGNEPTGVCCETACEGPCNRCALDAGTCQPVMAACSNNNPCTTDHCEMGQCVSESITCANGLSCSPATGCPSTPEPEQLQIISRAPTAARCGVAWAYQPITNAASNVSWSATGLPEGMTVNSSTGAMSYLPPPGVSTATITLAAFDGEHQAEQVIALQVECEQALDFQACGCGAGLGAPLLGLLGALLARRRRSATVLVLLFSASAWAVGAPGGFDAGATLPNGTECKTNRQCQSDLCSNGICCNDLCLGECQSCGEPGMAGTCVPVSNGAACGQVGPARCDEAFACMAGVCIATLPMACDPNESCDATTGQCLPPMGGGLKIVRDAFSRALYKERWSYNVDGHVNVVSAAGGSVTFKYCETGTPPEDFEIGENDGKVRWTPKVSGLTPLCIKATDGVNSDTYTFVVNVFEEASPLEVAIDVDPAEAPAGSSFAFHGKASVRNRPGVVTYDYRWSFGDGSFSDTNNQTTHLYRRPGTYQAKLSVRDELGRSENASVPVLVLDRQGGAGPLVNIATSTRKGDAPLAVQFECDCQASDAPIVAWRWETADGTVATGPTFSKLFTSGRHRVTLTVTDSEGRVGTDSVFINATVGGEEAPICALELDPPSGAAPFEVTHRALSIQDTTSVTFTFFNGEKKVGESEVTRLYPSAGRFRVDLAVGGGTLQCHDFGTVLATSTAGEAPTVFLPTLPAAKCGQPWLDATGAPLLAVATGDAPLTWSTQGQAPDGLTITDRGALSWTPARGAKGSFSFVVRAQNPVGLDEVPVTVQVECPGTLQLSTCGCDTASAAPWLLGALALLVRRVTRRACT